jgi:4'-phosphopantetheinyl transferase
MNGCLSISHSSGAAFCAWTPLTTQHIGADIELIAPHPQYFIEDYFTPFEIAQCAQAPEPLRADLVTAIWSAKEAVLKALRQGLKWDTRQVEINLSAINLEQTQFGIWYPAEVAQPKSKEKTWQLWIQRLPSLYTHVSLLKRNRRY